MKVWHGSTIIREINGSKMELDIRPSGPNKIDRTLALDGIREPGSTKVFSKRLKQLKAQFDSTIHVFDVGANIGYFALLEAHILADQGRIYAIEAEPENARRLQRNVELNSYSQIEVLPVAAGAEPSALELSIRGASNIHRMTEILGDKDQTRTIEVEVVAIDDLVAQRKIPEDELIVVRMDIEGYEAHAFRGMKKLLSSDRPVYIFVEVHSSCPHRDEVIDALEENGFSLEFGSSDKGEMISSEYAYNAIREMADQNVHIFAGRLDSPCGSQEVMRTIYPTT